MAPAECEKMQGISCQGEMGQLVQAVLMPCINAHHGYAQVLGPPHHPTVGVHSQQQASAT